MASRLMGGRAGGGLAFCAWTVFSASVLAGPDRLHQGDGGSPKPMAQGEDRAGSEGPALQLSLRGRVIDAGTGRPIAGALVEARLARHSGSPVIITSQNGAFAFDDLEPGKWTLSATKSGYLDAAADQQRPMGRSRAYELAAGTVVDDAVIRMWRPGIISGRVTSPSGNPLPGAPVRAVREDGPELPVGVVFSARYYMTGTDDRGEYEIGALPPGSYCVAVAIDHQTWAVGGRRGMMIDSRPWDQASMLTSTDGRFRLTLPIQSPPPPAPDGRETVYISTGYPGVTTRQDLATIEIASGQRVTNVDIRMTTAPRVRIRGIATGPEGRRLEKVYMRLLGGDMVPEGGFVSASTQPDGTFEFLSVPPGNYVLNANRRLGESDVVLPDPLGLWARMPLAVGDQNIDDLPVELRPGVAARARVVFNGATDPPRRFSINLEPINAADLFGGTGQQSVTLEGLVATGLAPGSYAISASAQGWSIESVTWRGRDITGEVIEIGSEDISDVVVTMTDRPTVVRGTVTATDRRGLFTAQVVIFAADLEKRIPPGRRARLPRPESPAPDGTYALHGMPPGDYFVAAVDETLMDDWPAPALLDLIARSATRITLSLGETRTLPLTVIRR
jgi:hypothetical protein